MEELKAVSNVDDDGALFDDMVFISADNASVKKLKKLDLRNITEEAISTC